MRKTDQKRQHILDTAYRLFQSKGFADTTMSEITSEAGGSKATVYNYFSSKDELFSSIVERELSQSLVRLGGEGEPDQAQLKRCLKLYLSMSHVEQPENGCALPALGAEIARADLAVRQQAENWIYRLQQRWAQALGSESQAWSILSQCVGALVVARMLVTADMQRQVLRSSHDEINRQLAGAV